MAKARKRRDDETDSQAAASTGGGREAIHGNNADYGDRVALRAYELYLARGRADGRDFDDWLAAEREVTSTRRDDQRE